MVIPGCKGGWEISSLTRVPKLCVLLQFGVGLCYLLVVKLKPDLVCPELSNDTYSFNDLVAIYLYY